MLACLLAGGGSQEGYVENGYEPKVKTVDDWLPITGSRNAKWWYSAFHNVTAMVGAGVLGLPKAMTYLTWSVSQYTRDTVS